MESESSRCLFVPVWMSSFYYLCLQEDGCMALGNAGGFLHGGIAFHLFSFPQAQIQSPLEPVAIPLAEIHWKWTSLFHPKQHSFNINPHVWSALGAR